MSDPSKNSPSHISGNASQMRESLSALMDGEANELELRRVLEHLGTDDQLRETAINYQRIGATIRNEQNAFADIDLSSSISAAIADEPAPVVESPAVGSLGVETRKAANSGWFANFTRLAVAASVAAATVVGVQSWNVAQRGDLDGGTELAAVTAPVEYVQPDNGGIASGYLPSADMFGARGLQAGFGTQQPGMTPEQMDQARGYADTVANARFRAYMMEHAEQMGARNSQGVLPYVRAASFTAPQ